MSVSPKHTQRQRSVNAKVFWSITGARDPYVPDDDVAAFRQEMTDAQADWQMTVYGRGFHAFTDPDIGEQDVPGAAYDPFLDRVSWAQATEFLAATVGG